jgi:NADH-quinone oxidoreductase subunit N
VVLAGTGLATLFFFLLPAPLLAAARQAVAALIG